MHAAAVARRALGPVAAALLFASCGGRVGDPIPERVLSDAPAHPTCASADGVRICGGSTMCPEITAPECPGYGCAPAHDIASTSMGVDGGICWADLPDQGGSSCSACEDGQVCLQRATDQLVCVSPRVCEALWDAGIKHVCRYADKSAYDHQSFATSDGCPANVDRHIACGGGCGPCPNGVRCVGRSPTHPFGLCTDAAGVPTVEVSPCSVTPGQPSIPGCNAFSSDKHISVCMIFSVPAVDRPAALQYGMCLFRSHCVALAASFPGGLECFDDDGHPAM